MRHTLGGAGRADEEIGRMLTEFGGTRDVVIAEDACKDVREEEHAEREQPTESRNFAEGGHRMY